MRLGEGFALHRSSVALDGSRIVVSLGLTEVNGKQVLDTPKSHQKREITIPASVSAELRAWVDKLLADGDPYLFTGANGKPLHYNWWRTAVFDPAAVRAGLVDVTPKDLRATHATWIADRLGVMAAAKRLGHSNASVTTRHYARAVEARQQETAQVLDDMRDAVAGTPPRRARKGHGKQAGRKPSA
jgi:integrase